jgi:sec-independent protein translocase protein TatB
VLDLSPDKLFMLAMVALVVLGPNRLPGAARSVGRFVGQIRSMSSSLQSEVREALAEPEDAFTTALAGFRPGDMRGSVRRVVTDVIAPFDSAPSSVPPADEAVVPLVPPASDASPAAVAWEGRPSPDDPSLN